MAGMFGLLRGWGATAEAGERPPEPRVGGSEGPVDPQGDAGEDGLDATLDTLASVLRSYGRTALDTEQASAESIRARCDEWARHVLNGAPAPGTTIALTPAQPDGVVPVRDRAWARLRKSFRDLRSGEVEHLGNVGTTLRGTLLELVDVVHKALEDGRDVDAELSVRARELRKALASEDVDALRAAAQRVTTSLEQSLEKREAIHERAVKVLGQRLRSVRDHLKEATRAAEVDKLTGLANRAALDRRIEASITLGRFTGQPECLLMLDIDHFKAVNDTHGHRIGDEVLAAIGICLARTVIRRNDFVARYGGEEFAIILSDTEPEEATIVGGRLLAEIRTLRIPLEGGDALSVTASLGVSDLRGDDSAATWLDSADHAMYRAKRDGRDQLCIRESTGFWPKPTFSD